MCQKPLLAMLEMINQNVIYYYFVCFKNSYTMNVWCWPMIIINIVNNLKFKPIIAYLMVMLSAKMKNNVDNIILYLASYKK